MGITILGMYRIFLCVVSFITGGYRRGDDTVARRHRLDHEHAHFRVGLNHWMANVPL